MLQRYCVGGRACVGLRCANATYIQLRYNRAAGVANAVPPHPA
jgi:hypothetical protein